MLDVSVDLVRVVLPKSLIPVSGRCHVGVKTDIYNSPGHRYVEGREQTPGDSECAKVCDQLVWHRISVIPHAHGLVTAASVVRANLFWLLLLLVFLAMVLWTIWYPNLIEPEVK